TVDSGNLLASLWVFAQGIHDILHAPILGHQCMRGLSDTLAQIEDSHRNDPSVAVPLQTLRKLLRGKSDTLSTIGRLRMATVQAWFAELDLHFQEAQRYAAQAVRDWRSLSARAHEFAASTNMAFLFDPKRKLFGIGYLVGGPVEFNSHYDLLASECRVASLVAIAKGDVPIEHWFTLGRPMVSRLQSHVPTEQTLLSWTGPMF